jgi:hypothetical protein
VIVIEVECCAVAEASASPHQVWECAFVGVLLFAARCGVAEVLASLHKGCVCLWLLSILRITLLYVVLLKSKRLCVGSGRVRMSLRLLVGL